MSFKSEAQKRKIKDLERQGKLAKGTYERWSSETVGKLPERKTPKKRPTSIEEIKEIAVKKYGKK